MILRKELVGLFSIMIMTFSCLCLEQPEEPRPNTTSTSVSLEELIGILSDGVTFNVTFRKEEAIFGINETIEMIVSKYVNFDEEELRKSLPYREETGEGLYTISYDYNSNESCFSWIDVGSGSTTTYPGWFSREWGNVVHTYQLELQPYSENLTEHIGNHTISIYISIMEETVYDDNTRTRTYDIHFLNRTFSLIGRSFH